MAEKKASLWASVVKRYSPADRLGNKVVGSVHLQVKSFATMFWLSLVGAMLERTGRHKTGVDVRVPLC